MNLSNEQAAALKECSSADEVVAKAAQAGYEISIEQAEKLLASNASAELDENELDAISGGCGTTTHYGCSLCNNRFEGRPPHRYLMSTFVGPANFVACEDCYQKHKDDFNWSC